MTLDDWAALGTLAGVLASLLFGITGLILGIVATVQSSRAKAQAARANELSERANTIAGEANGIAREANQATSEQIARETEQHDADWAWRWADEVPCDHVIVQNIGKSLAKGAVIQFTLDGATEAEGPVDVEGRHEVSVLLPGLADRRKFAAEAALNGIAWAIAKRTSPPPSELARVRLRVSWRTPRGTPRLHDTFDYEAPL